VGVPPKLMAGVRRSARTRGKSDPIDALAVAGAALREPDLPVAKLDGPSRELRLLVDYRESLVKDRTAAQNRLRWRLHELEPGYDPPPGSLNRYQTLDECDQLLGVTHQWLPLWEDVRSPGFGNSLEKPTSWNATSTNRLPNRFHHSWRTPVVELSPPPNS